MWGNGIALRPHSGADIPSGTVSTARLGTGAANATTFLRGDGSWAAAGGSETLPASIIDGERDRNRRDRAEHGGTPGGRGRSGGALTADSGGASGVKWSGSLAGGDTGRSSRSLSSWRHVMATTRRRCSARRRTAAAISNTDLWHGPGCHGRSVCLDVGRGRSAAVSQRSFRVAVRPAGSSTLANKRPPLLRSLRCRLERSRSAATIGVTPLAAGRTMWRPYAPDRGPVVFRCSREETT